MSKETIDIGAEGKFQLDTCKECQQVWFDGGELARWQIDHEQDAKGRDEAQMQRRSQMRTPEQQAAAAERIDNLPDATSFIGSTSQDLFYWVLCCALLFVVFVLWLMFNQSLLAGTVSLILAAILGWRLVREIESRLVFWGVIGVLAVSEIVFLFLLWSRS
jgi:Zn-finger nucleic acid-binding protein